MNNITPMTRPVFFADCIPTSKNVDSPDETYLLMVVLRKSGPEGFSTGFPDDNRTPVDFRGLSSTSTYDRNPAMKKHEAVETTFHRSGLKAIICVLALAGGFILIKPVQAMRGFLYARETTRLSRVNRPARNLAIRFETSQAGRAIKTKEITNSSVKQRPANLPRIVTQSKSASTFRGQHFSQKEVEALIRESAKRYGLPVDKVLRIARCESKLDHTVISRKGTYWGVYQFSIQMWNNMPEGKAKIDRRDAVVNINAAHRHMKAHGYSAWGCK
jgi:hypothetical protein